MTTSDPAPREPGPTRPTDTAVDAALIAEAASKSDLIWLDYEGVPQPRPVWHVWHEGAAYVLVGGVAVAERFSGRQAGVGGSRRRGPREDAEPAERLRGVAESSPRADTAVTVTGVGSFPMANTPAEQPLPGLVERASTTLDDLPVTVTSRTKDTGARLVSWRARVEIIPPGTPTWDAVVPALRTGRLNTPDTDRAPERWANECSLVRLTPTGEVVERPGRMPDDAQRQEPPDSPAATRGKLPWVVHRRPTSRPILS